MTKEKLMRLLELTFRDGIQVGLHGSTDPDMLPEMEALEAEFEAWETNSLLEQSNGIRRFSPSIRGWDPDDSEMYEEYEALKAALDEARALAKEMLGWIGARRPNWGEQHPWLFEGR